jgi:hypothetical protein
LSSILFRHAAVSVARPAGRSRDSDGVGDTGLITRAGEHAYGPYGQLQAPLWNPTEAGIAPWEEQGSPQSLRRSDRAVLSRPFADPISMLSSVSATSLDFPANLTFEDWVSFGRNLGRIQNVCLPWWVGEWWIAGHRYGERKAIVETEDWEGPSYRLCATYGSVVRAFERSRRREHLSLAHHREVMSLAPVEADELLDWAEAAIKENGRPRSMRELRIKTREVQQRKLESSSVPQLSPPDTVLTEPVTESRKRVDADPAVAAKQPFPETVIKGDRSLAAICAAIRAHAARHPTDMIDASEYLSMLASRGRGGAGGIQLDSGVDNLRGASHRRAYRAVGLAVLASVTDADGLIVSAAVADASDPTGSMPAGLGIAAPASMTAIGSTVALPLSQDILVEQKPGLLVLAAGQPSRADIALTRHQLALWAETLLQNYGAAGLVQIAEYLMARPEVKAVLANRRR